MTATGYELNPHLLKLLETGSMADNHGKPVSLYPASIPRETGCFLYDLILQCRPMHTIETGLEFGISTLFICDALKAVGGKRHYAVDPGQNDPRFSDVAGLGLRNLKDAGHLEMVEFMEAPSHRALPDLERRGLRFEFAFIDGMHTFDHALLDFFYLDLLLVTGGLLVIDDANFPCISRLCSFIVNNRAYEIIAMQGYGDANKKMNARCIAFKKLASDDDGRWKRFRDF